jgi:hypothetical protein
MKFLADRGRPGAAMPRADLGRHPLGPAHMKHAHRKGNLT